MRDEAAGSIARTSIFLRPCRVACSMGVHYSLVHITLPPLTTNKIGLKTAKEAIDLVVALVKGQGPGDQISSAERRIRVSQYPSGILSLHKG